MGVQFEAIPSEFDEQLDSSRSPDTVAKELALGKAMDVAKRYPDSLVIGADTIVTIDSEQLGKPVDSDDARTMLKKLSGKGHEVTTGIAIIRMRDGWQTLEADTTKVYFKPYDQQAVERYIITGDPLDKAGGYGIQSGAAPIIEYIEGEYDTVIGLPTILLAELLRKVGVAADSVELEPAVRQNVLSI